MSKIISQGSETLFYTICLLRLSNLGIIRAVRVVVLCHTHRDSSSVCELWYDEVHHSKHKMWDKSHKYVLHPVSIYLMALCQKIFSYWTLQSKYYSSGSYNLSSHK